MKLPALIKIENAYLSLLRFVVLGVATLLLVVAGVFGLSALKGLTAGTGKDAEVVAVSQDELLKALEAPKAETNISQRSKKASAENIDLYKQQIDRAAAAIANFVKANGNGLEVDDTRLHNYLRTRIEAQNEGVARKVFADGLAQHLEALLVRKEVIARIQLAPAVPAAPVYDENGQLVPQPPVQQGFKVSPFDVVTEVINAYQQLFAEKQAAEEDAAAETRSAAAVAKVESVQNLYLAGGCFGAFLMVVFLSIVIKIERNLRALAPVTGHEQS